MKVYGQNSSGPLPRNGLTKNRLTGSPSCTLPRGARYFGSRRAYDLTYTSCRESGQFRRLYNSIAAEVGSTP